MIFYKNGHEIRTWVSPDGKSMHASISTKPGPSGSMRHYSTEDGQYVPEGALLAENGQIASDAGGISGSSEVRGPVTQQQAEKYPPPPPAPKEPHLTYSIGEHTLRDPDGGVVDAEAYSGKGLHRNKAASQDIEDFGPIPEGNWRVQQVDQEYCDKQQPQAAGLPPDS